MTSDVEALVRSWSSGTGQLVVLTGAGATRRQVNNCRTVTAMREPATTFPEVAHMHNLDLCRRISCQWHPNVQGSGRLLDGRLGQIQGSGDGNLSELQVRKGISSGLLALLLIMSALLCLLWHCTCWRRCHDMRSGGHRSMPDVLMRTIGPCPQQRVVFTNQ